MAEDLEDLIGRDVLLRGQAFRLERVKVKFGDLRVYYVGSTGIDAGDEWLEAIVARAILRSGGTCERCGRPGTLAFHAGWWSTLCTEHHSDEEARYGLRRRGRP